MQDLDGEGSTDRLGPHPPSTRLRPLTCGTGAERRTATTRPSGTLAGDKRRVLGSAVGLGAMQLLFSWRAEASSGTLALCGHRANVIHRPASVSCLGKEELIPVATFYLKT